MECEEDEVEDDAEGEKNALAEGVTDGGPGKAGGEEAQADEVGEEGVGGDEAGIEEEGAPEDRGEHDQQVERMSIG